MDYRSGKTLDIGETISLAFSLIGDHIGSAGIFVMILFARDAILEVLTKDASIKTFQQIAMLAFIYLLFFGVITIVAHLAMVKIFLSRGYEQDTFFSALPDVLRKFFPFIGASILMSLGGGLFSLLFIIPGIMLVMRWIVYTQVIIDEGAGAAQSLRRSAELTNGHRWKIFGFFLLFTFMTAIFSAVVNVPIFIEFSVHKIVAGHSVPEPTMTGRLMMSIVSGIAMVFSLAAFAALYKRLKELHTGIDQDRIEAVFR